MAPWERYAAAPDSIAQQAPQPSEPWKKYAVTEEAPTAQPRQDDAIRRENEETPFLSRENGKQFLDSIDRGAAKRVSGLIEFGLNTSPLAYGLEKAGLIDTTDFRDDLAHVQREYERRGNGTGVTGAVGEAIGDPLSWLAGGQGAKVAGRAIEQGSKFIPRALQAGKDLAKVGAQQGAIAGATTATGDADSDALDNATNAAKGAAAGALLTPVLAPIVGGAAYVVVKGAGGVSRAIPKAAYDVVKDEAGAVPLKWTRSKLQQIEKIKFSAAEQSVMRALLQEQGLTPAEASKLIRGAGTDVSGTGVKTTLPEQAGGDRLRGYQARLAESSGEASQRINDFTSGRGKDFAADFQGYLSQHIGTVKAQHQAGAGVQSAATAAIRAAKDARSAFSKPHYAKADLETVTPEAASKLVQNPTVKDALGFVSRDSDYAAALKSQDELSLQRFDLAKKHLDARHKAAIKEGDDYRASLIDDARKLITSTLDETNEAYRLGRRAHAVASPHVKETEDLLAPLAKIKDPAKAHAVFFAGTPEQVAKRAKALREIDPTAVDDLIASHIDTVAKGKTSGYSPTRILNALSDELTNGSTLNAQTFAAALRPKQREAMRRVFAELKKAQSVRFGSPTEKNQFARNELNSDLQGLTEKGADALRKNGLKPTEYAADLVNWLRLSVQSKRYDELARIFVGEGAEDFADRLATLKPGGYDAARVISERIRNVRGVGASVAGQESGAVVTSQTKPTRSTGVKDFARDESGSVPGDKGKGGPASRTSEGTRLGADPAATMDFSDIEGKSRPFGEMTERERFDHFVGLTRDQRVVTLKDAPTDPRAARREASESFGGTTVRNESRGIDIEIPKSGIKHAMSRADSDKALLMQAVPQLLQQAKLVGAQADNKGRRQIARVLYFDAPVKIGNRVTIARLVVRQADDGHRYYDHQASEILGSANGSVPKETAPFIADPGEPTDGNARRDITPSKADPASDSTRGHDIGQDSTVSGGAQGDADGGTGGDTLARGDWLDRWAQAESGGRADAVPKGRDGKLMSNAVGLFQFVPATVDLVNKKYGERYGLEGDWRLDPAKSRLATQLLTYDNNQLFKARYKRGASEGELYGMHVLGSGDYIALRQNPHVPAAMVAPAAARSNPDLFRRATGDAVLKRLAAKVA